MNDPNTFLKKNFSIKSEHLDFLNTVNPDNDSKALRDCLDELRERRNGSKQSAEKQVKQEFMHDVIVVFGLSCIFMLFGYSNLLSGNMVTFTLSIVVGCFLLFYDVLKVVRQYKVQ